MRANPDFLMKEKCVSESGLYELAFLEIAAFIRISFLLRIASLILKGNIFRKINEKFRLSFLSDQFYRNIDAQNCQKLGTIQA